MVHDAVAVHQGAVGVAQLDGDTLFVFGGRAVQLFAGADIAEEIVHFGVGFQLQGEALLAQQGDAAVRPDQDLLLVQLVVEDVLAIGGAGLAGVLGFGDGEVDHAAVADGAHQLVDVIRRAVVVGLAAAGGGIDRRDPVVLAVGRVVVVARQVSGDLVGEALEIHFLAGFQGDAGDVVPGHDLVEDLHALLRGEHHQLAVLVDGGELVAAEGVGRLHAVHGVDPLALFVEGVGPQGTQVAQVLGHDLVGGVGLAVELGAESNVVVAVQHKGQHQAVLGEVEGVGDAVAGTLDLVVFRQGDLLDGDVRQRAGDEHGGLFVAAHRAAGPQHQQAVGEVGRGAVTAHLHLVEIDDVAFSVFQRIAVFVYQQGVAGEFFLVVQLCCEGVGAAAEVIERRGGVAQQVTAVGVDGVHSRQLHKAAAAVQGAHVVLQIGVPAAAGKVDEQLLAVQAVFDQVGGDIAACVVGVVAKHRVAGLFQHGGGVGQRCVRVGGVVAFAGGGTQVPARLGLVGGGLVYDGVVLAVACLFILVYRVAGSVVRGFECNGDIFLLAVFAHDESALAGIPLVVAGVRHDGLGGVDAFHHQGVGVAVGFQVKPSAGVTVHLIEVHATHHLGRGAAQVRPDILAVQVHPLALGVGHVVVVLAGHVFRLGVELAGVGAVPDVIAFIQRAVRRLIHRHVVGGILHTAGIILCGQGGGDRLHPGVGDGRRVAVQEMPDRRVLLGLGFVLVAMVQLGVDEFADPEDMAVVGADSEFIVVGFDLGLGEGVGSDVAFPHHAVEGAVEQAGLSADVLPRLHDIAHTVQPYDRDIHAFVGQGAVFGVPYGVVAGAGKIFHSVVIAGPDLYPPQVDGAARSVPVAGIRVMIPVYLVVGHPVGKGVGLHRIAVQKEDVAVEVILVGIALLGLHRTAGESEQPQAVAVRVMNEHIVIGFVRRALDGAHRRLQAAEVVIVHTRAAAGQNRHQVHLFHTVLVGQVGAGLRVRGDQTDTGAAAAVQQAPVDEPFRVDRLQQHLVGSVPLHGEVAGDKVDGDALAKLDLHHVALGVFHELEVAHRRFGAALFDAGDVAPGIHVKQGAVGQQIAVEPLGGVVALEVVVQRVLAGEDVLRSQLHGVAGDVAQGAGHRDGDGGAAGDHGGLHARFQVQVDVAIQRDHPLDVDRVLVALQHLIVLVHDDQGHRYDVHEHIAAGLDVHHAVGAGEHIGVERLVLCAHAFAHAGGALDQQVMGPHREHGVAGGDVGDVGNAGERAALFAGPDELHMAVGVGHKAADLHAAGAAEFGAHLGLFVVDVRDGVADAEHAGLDEAAVGNVDTVQLHVKARAVGDDDPGQHRLVVDGDAAGGVGVAEAEVRHAGQVVADVAEDDGIARQAIEVAGVLDAHFPHGELALVLGDVDVDAARRVAQVKGGAVGHRDAAVACEVVAGVGHLDDEAAFAGVPPDAAPLEAVAGDRHGGAPQGDAAAQHGVGECLCGAAGPGQGFARRVQLDGGPHVDVGVPVGGLGGGVDVQAVVAGDVGPGDVHQCVQGGVGFAYGVHRRAEGRALGVGVGVDVHLAVAGDDLHVPPLDHNGHAGGAGDLHVGVKAGVHIGGGVGRHPQAGGVGADIGLHPGLGGVGEDVHRAEAGLDASAGADLHLCAGVDVHIGGGGAQGHKAVGAHLGAGGDPVGLAARGVDDQVAVVGGQQAVGPDEDGHRPRQGVLRPKHLAGDQAAAVGIGGGVHAGDGRGLHRQALVGVQGAVDLNGVGGVDGVAAVGDVRVDGDADAGAAGHAFGLGVVLAEHVHTAAGGADDRAVQHVHAGVVPGFGGQHGDPGAAGGHGLALFNACLGVAGVVGAQGHVLLRLDGAAVHFHGHRLAAGGGGAHGGLGGVHAAGHQAHVGLAGGGGAGGGVADGLGGNGAADGHFKALHQHFHRVAGG